MKISEINGGVLAEFETELTAAVYVKSKRSNCVDSTSEDEDLEVFAVNLRTKLLTLSTATTAGSRIRLQIDAHAVQSVLYSFRIAKPKMWKSQHSISM